MALLNLRRSCTRLGRPSLGRLVLLAALSLCLTPLLIFPALPASKWNYAPVGVLDNVWPSVKRMPIAKPPMPMLQRVACDGPRGRSLLQSPDDDLRSVRLDIRMSPRLMLRQEMTADANHSVTQPTRTPSLDRTQTSASTNHG